MARFRGTVRGKAGEASRLGNEESGMGATVDGWNVGVEIDAVPLNLDPAQDTITVKATSGSNGGRQRTIAVIWGFPPTIDLYKDERIIASFPLD